MEILFNNSNKEFWSKKEIKKLTKDNSLKKKIINFKMKLFHL